MGAGQHDEEKEQGQEAGEGARAGLLHGIYKGLKTNKVSDHLEDAENPQDPDLGQQL